MSLGPGEEGKQVGGTKGEAGPGSRSPLTSPNLSSTGQAQHQCQGSGFLSTKPPGGFWRWGVG